MPSLHDTISNVQRELEEMRSLSMIDERSYAAALRYIAGHTDEINAMCEYSSIGEVADSVADIARSCSSGQCS